MFSYFDRPVQKNEWRVDVRGEDLLPPLNMHSHGGHPGSNAFLAPQPLQGSSKAEPRPLPPAPGPPAPTFRYVHLFTNCNESNKNSKHNKI